MKVPTVLKFPGSIKSNKFCVELLLLLFFFCFSNFDNADSVIRDNLRITPFTADSFNPLVKIVFSLHIRRLAVKKENQTKCLLSRIVDQENSNGRKKKKHSNWGQNEWNTTKNSIQMTKNEENLCKNTGSYNSKLICCVKC